MKNRARNSLVTVALAGVLILFMVFSAGQSNSSRHIRFNGSFVLVDQARLMADVESISLKYPDNDRFASEIISMLGEKKYIRNHSIRYSWPDEVIINITEISPMALLNEDMLIADDCSLHEHIADSGKERLIHVIAPVNMDGAHLCRRIKDIVPHLASLDIDRVEIIPNDNYRIVVNGVVYVIPGVFIQKEIAKLSWVSKVLAARKVSVAGVDLRYSSGGAIRPL